VVESIGGGTGRRPSTCGAVSANSQGAQRTRSEGRSVVRSVALARRSAGVGRWATQRSRGSRMGGVCRIIRRRGDTGDPNAASAALGGLGDIASWPTMHVLEAMSSRLSAAGVPTATRIGHAPRARPCA
jgi:hypothetical protein